MMTGARPRKQRAAASGPSWIRSSRVRKCVGDTLAFAIIVLGAIVISTPLFWQVTTSLKTPQDLFAWPPRWIPWPPHWANYREVAAIVPLGQYAWNSVRLCIMVLAGTLVSNSMVAYGFSRLRFPGRDVLFLILISPMVLPSTVLLVPRFVIMQRLGWYNSYWPLVVPSYFGDAFSIFLLRQFFLTIPFELEDAARIDGAGFFDTYLSIVLPMAKPALATVAIISFVWVWNDFVGPLVWVSDMRLFTLPLGLAFFQGSPRAATQLHLLMAMATVIAAPCVLAFVLAQRVFMRGITYTGLKG